MSRAVDPELLVSLKSDEALVVYKDIATVLATVPDHGLLEVELLGRSHPLEPGINFLQDGPAIAIPKLRLVEAFLVARQIVQRHITAGPEVPQDEVMEATAVLLLMDPEHLTAANIRKRAILAKLASGAPAESVMRQERLLVDSLLTARLHRHTKSPNLWSHRRWLLEQFGAFGIPVDAREDVVNVVMVAAERHPRNYYAWDHARKLVRGTSGQVQMPVYGRIIEDTKKWTFRHHDDISGWACLGYFIINLGVEGERKSKCSTIVRETLDAARAFRWANESVWVFLQSMVPFGDDEEELLEYFDVVSKEVSSTAQPNSASSRSLTKAQRWAAQYRQVLASACRSSKQCTVD